MNVARLASNRSIRKVVALSRTLDFLATRIFILTRCLRSLFCAVLTSWSCCCQDGWTSTTGAANRSPSQVSLAEPWHGPR